MYLSLWCDSGGLSLVVVLASEPEITIIRSRNFRRSEFLELNGAVFDFNQGILYLRRSSSMICE